MKPKETEEKEPQKQAAELRQKAKTVGIVLTVISGSLIFWVYSRFTSLMGRLHSWSPPFTEYETTTIAVGVIAVIMLIVGIRSLIKK